MSGFGLERQRQIFLDGLRGRKPAIPIQPAALEEGARRVMTPEGFAYVAGGAGAEVTLRANRAAFERCAIVPRVLRDVATRDATVELFGRRLPAPLLLAPVGVLEMAHPEADLAVARAAARVGVPLIFSSQASHPMEACAAAMGDGPRWFQLYWNAVDAVMESFVRRAVACGCDAIVLTVDTTLIGWRPRDLDLAYLPFLHGKGIANYVSDPVFRASVAEPGDAVERFAATFPRPSLSWADLPRLRALTKLPLLLKGILHPDDARRALDAGVDGLVVSNHGGRQGRRDRGARRAARGGRGGGGAGARPRAARLRCPDGRRCVQGARPGRGRGVHRSALRVRAGPGRRGGGGGGDRGSLGRLRSHPGARGLPHGARDRPGDADAGGLNPSGAARERYGWRRIGGVRLSPSI